ncbi:MAG: response regulator transcription factor [Armatimonadota bacterium]
MGNAKTVGEPSGEKKKVMLVDSETIVREVLAKQLLEDTNLCVVSSVGSISEANAALMEVTPDIILLEVKLPDGSGISWVRDLKMSHRKAKIIFITSDMSERTALMAIGMGADGYFLKHSSLKQLLDTISIVASGHYAYDPSVVAPVVQKFARIYCNDLVSENTPEMGLLSDREKEIATLASQGLTNEQIAELTFVTVSTVKTHLRRIYKRLGISSRRQLIQNQMLSDHA